MGQLDHLLPEEYVVTMRNNLLDRCPVRCRCLVKLLLCSCNSITRHCLIKHANHRTTHMPHDSGHAAAGG